MMYNPCFHKKINWDVGKVHYIPNCVTIKRRTSPGLEPLREVFMELIHEKLKKHETERESHTKSERNSPN